MLIKKLNFLVKFLILATFISINICYAQSNINTSRQNAITKTVAMCSPAIVGINVTEIRGYTRERSFWDDFFG